MYNRYIPQPDGSYRRNRLPDSAPSQNHSAQSQRPPCVSEPPQEPPYSQPAPSASQSCPPPPSQQPGRNGQSQRNGRQSLRHPPGYQTPSQHASPPAGTGILGFFRQMLPKDFDTEDLLVVLLLLLMSGDCKEDRNFALLTLALYMLNLC